MDGNIINNEIEAYSQFEKWLNEQPYWLQDATYRIYHSQPIEQQQIIDYANMCISQSKKENVDHKKLPENASKMQKNYSQLIVRKLDSIVGVNALSKDASLAFSDNGVTVIYGLNGAGKSGYMRIFKQLSGCPYEEVIQPNVYKKSENEKPKCRFSIVKDGEEIEVNCDLSSKEKNTPLANCDVFDTRISNDYITKTNNVSYQPFVFSVLSELSKVADKVNEYINSQIDLIPSEKINLPNEYVNSIDAEWIINLNKNTVFKEKYLKWSREQQCELEELPKKLDTDKVQSDYKLLKSQLTIVETILTDLTNAKKLINSNETKNVYITYEKTKQELLLAECLFTDNADKLDKISVDLFEWKELWSMARRYYDEILYGQRGVHFGEIGSICPLCHREVTDDLERRFKSVNEYVNGSCNEKHNESIKLLREKNREIVNRSNTVFQIENHLSSILDGKKLQIIRKTYSKFEEKQYELDEEKEYDRLTQINLDESIEILTNKRNELSDECHSLKVNLDDERRGYIQQKYDSLKFHKWVYDNKDLIEKKIADLRKRDELKKALSLLTTNKITSESNILADTLITDAYINRFNNEIKGLAPKLQVKLEKASSKKGSTPYKVSIKTDSGIKCKPEDILSEGEQRIVALSAFFADATGRNIRTPLIIDDPISSLDLNYESRATQQIVEIARERQVVVFTHRISLLTGIHEMCEQLNVEVKENFIRSTLKGKGVPDFEDIYHGKLQTQLQGIKDRVAKIKKMDYDSQEYTEAIGKQCQQFRICVERSVEDILLLGMVHRFDRRIMTNGKVMKLTRINDKDCRFIDDMMTKYSFTEHSQPIDCPPSIIEADELYKDISDYLNWIKEYNKKMN